MNGQRLWSVSSRKLAILFLAVVAPPAVTLIWLGLQLVQQDRSLLAQRKLESSQATGQTIIRSLERLLSDAGRRISEGPLPDGTVRFLISDAGVHADSAASVLWLPVPHRLREAGPEAFTDGEALEFRGNTSRALAGYRELALSADAGVRAGALLRVARVNRRERKWDGAQGAYRRLALLTNAAIDGTPADLVARTANCAVLEESGNKPELASEAAAIESDLVAGRWTLDRPAWELTAAKVEQWTARKIQASAERKQASAVADWLWEEWKSGRHTPQIPRAIVVESNTVTLLSQGSGADLAVLAILSPGLREWIARAVKGTSLTDTQVRLLADSGATLAGSALPVGQGALRLLKSDTGLPWTLVLTPADSAVEERSFAQRRRLLSAGLAAIMLLLGGGSYILWRMVQRELAVARLQTDFVAAVSHEFRTPLASLRHITELLDEDDNLPNQRRRLFYQALGRNTERLHRLVESLLDFARMESGRKPYDLRRTDVSALAEQVVADFEKEAHGFTIDLDVERGLEMPADADSLTHAIWNLLDNAVKYSPERGRVMVGVHRHPSGVAISVRDHGMGISDRERKDIFRRFVRGEKARGLGIKGTGLGLAIVSHVVQAHDGTIEVESKEGAGSTFRLVLPARR